MTLTRKAYFVGGGTQCLDTRKVMLPVSLWPRRTTP